MEKESDEVKKAGRPKGKPNRVTSEFRDTVRQLLEDNSANVGHWLMKVANGDDFAGVKPDPAKALDLLAKLAEFAAPKLSRAEVETHVSGELEIRRIERVIVDAGQK